MKARIYKYQKIIRLINFVLFMLFLNNLLQFVFNVDRQLYRFQTHDFVEENGAFDYVAFGPSDCLNTFDTMAVESNFHKKAFNFGGTGISYKQVIRFLFDSKINQVQEGTNIIFFVPDYELMLGDEMPKEAYYQYLTIDPINKGRMFFVSSMNSLALERLCPWQEVFVTPYDASFAEEFLHPFNVGYDNITDKFSDNYNNYDLSVINRPDRFFNYEYNGYASIATGDDPIVEINYISSLLDSYDYSDVKVAVDTLSVKSIEYVIRSSIQHNCRPIVIMGPQRVDSILQDANYFVLSDTLKRISEDAGALYIDMNLIYSEIYRPCFSDWHDDAHFNSKGAKSYTIALCNMINALYDKRIDNDNTFYKNPSEYLASLRE